MKKKAKDVEQVQYNTVENCSFTGVQFDAKAVDAIQTIAEGLLENAKSLGKLSEVLRAGNVHIDAMVKIAPYKGVKL